MFWLSNMKNHFYYILLAVGLKSLCEENQTDSATFFGVDNLFLLLVSVNGTK